MFAYPGLMQNTWPLRKDQREKSMVINGTFCSDNG